MIKVIYQINDKSEVKGKCGISLQYFAGLFSQLKEIQVYNSNIHCQIMHSSDTIPLLTIN